MSVRIYLDNCCYNRPYDDQTQLRISLESQAKLYIQELIRENRFELVTSYILVYENSRNRAAAKREAILRYIEDCSSIYVDVSRSDDVQMLAESVARTGIKPFDSLHTACAILAGCDYLLTTDDRLLRYVDDRIRIINPTEFVRLIDGGDISV